MTKIYFFLSLRLSSLSEVFLFLSLCPCLSTSSVRVGCQCGSMDVLVGFQVSEWQTVPRYITISTRQGEAHVRIFPTRASLD
ncbi:hypothetical protein EDB83DRAFT_2425437 [Lactarius deliciosus]|nr:hypothetical protein EDB83DRAFT_2425437 [Lactarius deliciosus]